MLLSWHSAAQEVEAHSLPHLALATLLVKTSLHLAIWKLKKKHEKCQYLLTDPPWLGCPKYSFSTTWCLQCAHEVARLCHWDSPMEVQSPPQTGLKKGHAVDFEASEIPTDVPPFFRFPKDSWSFDSQVSFGKKTKKQTNCSIYFC